MSNQKLSPHLWTIEDLFKSMYEVPIYQRPYSWEKEQVKTLLEDLFENYESADKNNGYYTGNVLIHDKGDDPINGLISKYNLVDGQQRITTFSLMLLSIYSIAISRGANNDDTLTKIKSSLWKIIQRQSDKNLRAVTLNSVEKQCFINIFNACFENPKDIMSYISSTSYQSKHEKNVLDNFKFIYTTINNHIKDKKDEFNEILDFADYILQYVYVIAIISKNSTNKMFSMFESLNNKGKMLDEIDLIKTYIFSNIDEDSHETYLEKWGQLIITTNDNLYDYLYHYVRAYFYYYRTNIFVANFKSLSKKEMPAYFTTTTLSDTFKKLLDNMIENVKYYNMLSSLEKACKLISKNKFKFYYKVFTDISYVHPKSLFLRAFIELGNGKITKDDVEEIVVETISFMLKFLTIGKRDSKDAITMFSTIMNEIYKNNKIDKNLVVSIIAGELIKQGLTPERLKNDLKALDGFNGHKTVSVALLSLFEATTKDEKGKIKTSYDQAFTLLNSFSQSFSLDHLLVQTPDPNDANLKYYKIEKANDKDSLKLKNGHDFPANIVIDGMDYDLFTSQILNKIGNLRIYYKDKNSGRQNTVTQLKNYDEFTTYKQVEDRSNELVDLLIDECMKAPKLDTKKAQSINQDKTKDALPKIDKLIELKILNPNDKLYFISYPSSIAEIVDSEHVLFNDEEITFEQWAKKVTKKKNVDIYKNVAKVNETETLEDKRINYINNINE